MNLLDTIRAIESDQFAAEVNLASGSRAFHRGLQNHRLFRELADRMNEPGARENIMGRLLELTRLPIDMQYENPFDAAITAYLMVLDERAEPEVLRVAAEAVLKAPNCWWAAETSAHVLSKLMVRRLRNAVALGNIEHLLTTQAAVGAIGNSEMVQYPLAAGTVARARMYYEGTPPLVAAPIRRSGGVHRHRKIRRARAA